MKKQSTTDLERLPSALPALKRAAKQALELALLTNTPCWVMEGNKLVDLTKSVRGTGTASGTKPRKPVRRKRVD